MLISSKGIVLHCMDYSETSVIVKVFTEQIGLQSYIVKGVRKKDARIKRNLFAPVSIIRLMANHKEGEGLRLMREASCETQLNGIAADMPKTAVSIFIAELLSRAITAQMADAKLFAFIENAVVELDASTTPIATFPLSFAIELSQHLGFGPDNNHSVSATCFDMLEGKFCTHAPSHPFHFFEPLSSQLAAVLQNISTGLSELNLPSPVRTELLTKLLEYYRIHIPSFGLMKSVQVLSAVLNV